MNREKSSFRDPSGFVFEKDNNLYRQINKFGADNYELSMSSGLYQALISKGLLIKHKEVNSGIGEGDCLYKVIEMDKIDFISYPYEWSFEQLKDAALLTLQIQKLSLEYNMSLKDATNYNVQFNGCEPIFIDTLSFEKYQEGTPWIAYKQFCEHFFAPLILMKYTDIRLNSLLKVFLDGIPLDLASSILPSKTRLIPSIMVHIHMHAKSQKKYEEAYEIKASEKQSLPKKSLITLLSSLELFIKDMSLSKNIDTEWGDYYNNTNYTDRSSNHKREVVKKYLGIADPKTLWDLGANTGEYSRLASGKGIFTVAFDIDPIAVNKNYVNMKSKKETNILPLMLDLTNPSPGIGWDNNERREIKERGTPDCVMALALIHHLAISNNVPFSKLAEFFSSLSPYLIIEFVPKEDSQVKKLLSTREDIFPSYGNTGFEKEFNNYYDIIEKTDVVDSVRVLYLLKRKG